MRKKHARRRMRRRVGQGLWSAADLSGFQDSLMFRKPGMRRSLQSIKGSDYITRPFLVLQRRYPWPALSEEPDTFRIHSAMLRRREARLKKIHTAYRRRS